MRGASAGATSARGGASLRTSSARCLWRAARLEALRRGDVALEHHEGDVAACMKHEERQIQPPRRARDANHRRHRCTLCPGAWADLSPFAATPETPLSSSGAAREYEHAGAVFICCALLASWNCRSWE